MQYFNKEHVWLTFVWTSCSRSRETSSAMEISDDDVLTADGGRPLTFTAGSLLTKLKLKLNDIALYVKSSQSYEASLALWDHTVLPATRHK